MMKPCLGAIALSSSLLFMAVFLPWANAEETEQQRLERVLKDFEKTTIQIARIEGPVKIDGDLGDDAWQEAATVDIAWQHTPVAGVPAPTRTTVHIMEDGKNLYVGFDAEDPEPEKIRAFLRRRDTFFVDDYVGFCIDTVGDGSRAYSFFSNPLGVQGDAVIDLFRGEDFSYDAIFQTSGQITERGFEVEFAIPLNQIRFPKRAGKQKWKMLFTRTWFRGQRYQSFQYPIDRNNACFTCQYQPAEGLAGAVPGKRFQVIPTLTANTTETDDPLGGGSEREYDPEFGIDDFRWGITPDITLNATYNPDFSQIEADVARMAVNTTFTLYYPETRPFFLEGRDFFSTHLNLVNTRNISDPNFAAKLTGKVGSNVYGLMTARDRVTHINVTGSQSSNIEKLPEEHQASVLRYRRDLGDASHIGVLVTDRRGEDYLNQVFSIDGSYSITKTDRLNLQAVHTRSENPPPLVNARSLEPEYEGNAYGLSYFHFGPNWSWSLARVTFDKDFRADPGFMNQSDVQVASANVNYLWRRQPGDFFRQVGIGASASDSVTVEEDAFLTRGGGGSLNLSLPRNTAVSFSYGHRKQSYYGREFNLGVSTLALSLNPSDGFYSSSQVTFGDEVDYANARRGEALILGQALSYNIGRHLLLGLQHTYHRLRIGEEGLFTSNLTDLRLTYQFSLLSSLRLALIYSDTVRDPGLYWFPIDAQTISLDAQLLYTYQLNPQSVLFAGYSSSGIDNDHLPHIEKTSDTVFVKMSYAWRL